MCFLQNIERLSMSQKVLVLILYANERQSILFIYQGFNGCFKIINEWSNYFNIIFMKICHQICLFKMNNIGLKPLLPYYT